MISNAGSSSQEQNSKLAEAGEKMTEQMKKEFSFVGEENSELAPRILLIGPSDVRKSSLVSAVFGLKEVEQAKARAAGRPCMQNYEEYGPFERVPIIINVAEEIEKKDTETQRDEVVEYIRRTNSDIDPCKHVHLAWYLSDMSWGKCDEEYVKRLKDVVSVVIVMTKSHLHQQIDPGTGRVGKEATHQAIAKSVPEVPVVECADPEMGSTKWVPMLGSNLGSKSNFSISNVKGTLTCKEIEAGGALGQKEDGPSAGYGYVELVHQTMRGIPNMFRNSLLIAQVVDIERKNVEAAAIIAFHTTLAMGAEAVSLPFSDVPMLLGVEVSMAAAICNLYDINPDIVSWETWFELNADIAGNAGCLCVHSSEERKLTNALNELRALVVPSIIGNVLATLGCALAVFCRDLPPRATFTDMDKSKFAAKLLRAAKVMGEVGIDGALKSAAQSVDGFRTDQNILGQELARFINDCADLHSPARTS